MVYQSSAYHHLAKSINLWEWNSKSIMRMEFQTTGTVAPKTIIISNLPLNFTLFNWFCIVIRFKYHWYHLKTVNGLALTQKSYNLRSLCHYWNWSSNLRTLCIHKCSARINKNRKPFCEINEKKNYREIKFANESLFHDHRRARTFEFTVHFV